MEEMKRILHRDRPKVDILENMTRAMFKKTECDEVIVDMKPNKQTRSDLQNNLYFHIVDSIRKETANTKEAIHDHLRGEFLETTTETVCNKQHIVLKSTKTLNTKEMGEYINECIAFAEGFLGIRLSLPDDWRGLVE